MNNPRLTNQRNKIKRVDVMAHPAELELVGTLLNRPESLGEVDFLVREDFAEGRHFDIYQAVKQLREAGAEVSVLTVGDAIGADRDQYAYMVLLVKDYGMYSGNFRYRAVVMRKCATARACEAAAKAHDWARIVQLQKEQERLEIGPPKTMTARELLALEFPPLRWLVEGVLPEGVTLLVSPPKVGKTRLATQLAVAVASGGYALNHPDTTCQPSEVLYLILESGNRRAQKDLRQLGGDAPPAVDRLHTAADWRRLSAGGASDLERWLDAHPAVKLVVVDTLAAVRSAGHGANGFLYSEDYLVGATIKGIADKRGLSVLLIHHSRKAEAEDVLDTVSGSSGVTGSVDHILVIKRKRLEQDGTLTLISRDFEDRALALRYRSGLWTLLGPADEVSAADQDWKGDGQSDARREILALLRDEPMTPADLSEVLDKNQVTTRRLLMKMVEAGKVGRRFDGKYAVLDAVHVDSVHTVHTVHGVHANLTIGDSTVKTFGFQLHKSANQSDMPFSETAKISVNAVNGVNAVNAVNGVDSATLATTGGNVPPPGSVWDGDSGRWVGKDEVQP